MPEISGIYDNAPIQPIAKIKQNLAIWTLGKWQYFIILYEDPIPPTPASIVDMVAQAGVTTLAANGTIARRVVTILQVNDFEFLHFRFEPLDNIEVLVWQQSGQQKLASRNIHSRVNRSSRIWDPHLALTTTFVLGLNRDANLEVRNPMGYAVPAARVQTWGIRYTLESFRFPANLTQDQKIKLDIGDRAYVESVCGPVQWLPAEGRQS